MSLCKSTEHIILEIALGMELWDLFYDKIKQRHWTNALRGFEIVLFEFGHLNNHFYLVDWVTDTFEDQQHLKSLKCWIFSGLKKTYWKCPHQNINKKVLKSCIIAGLENAGDLDSLYDPLVWNHNKSQWQYIWTVLFKRDNLFTTTFLEVLEETYTGIYVGIERYYLSNFAGHCKFLK